MMDKILRYQEIKVLEHKRYLFGVINDHRIALLATLLPAFLWGWKKGRQKGLGKIVKQIMKVGILTSFSHIKRRLAAH